MKFLMQHGFLLICFNMCLVGLFAHKGTNDFSNSSSGNNTKPKALMNELQKKCFFETEKDLVIPKIHVIKPLKQYPGQFAVLKTDGSIQIWSWKDDASWTKTIVTGEVSKNSYGNFFGSLLEIPGGKLVSLIGNSSTGAVINMWDMKKNKRIKTCPDLCWWPKPLLVTSLKNPNSIAFQSDYETVTVWDIEKDTTEKLESGSHVIPNGFYINQKGVYDIETKKLYFEDKINIEDLNTATPLFPYKMAFISSDGQRIIIHDRGENKTVVNFVAHEAGISSLAVIYVDIKTYLLISGDIYGHLKIWFGGILSSGNGATELSSVSIDYDCGIKYMDTDNGKTLFIVFNDDSVKIVTFKKNLDVPQQLFFQLF